MKVLVVGGTRFMGKHLVHALLEGGHDITVANRGITTDDFCGSVKRIKIERTNCENMKAALSNHYFDVVYDSLAYCSNDVKNLLDAVKCGKYIFISTTAVYDKHIDTKEDEFSPLSKTLVWCNRNDFPYDEIKRHAECVVVQEYPQIKSIAVRFPFVIGRDDYTKRLYFYIDHIINQKPLYIDNFSSQMSFVRSDEAGKFLAYLCENDFCGAINGASNQTISLQEIAEYVKLKTNKTVILSENGDIAPYNGEVEYSINTDKANALGFSFSPLKSWIFDLIDYFIDTCAER